MQLAGDGAHLFRQRRFDESVDILIGHRLHFVRRILTQDAFKAAVDGLPFFLGKDARTKQPLGVRSARADIDLEKNSIDRKRSIHFFEDGILIFFKPSLPEFHTSRG